MKKIRISKRYSVLALLVGIFGFCIAFYIFVPKPWTDQPDFDQLPNRSTLKQNTKTDPSGIPARLLIPTIGVDAGVVEVGIGTDGSMESPNSPSGTAWYNLGKKPGETGSAVIAGHFGTWKGGEGSVFDKLNQLKVGDKLSVIDEAGVTVTFVVRESRKFKSEADATDIFRSNDGLAHLNLITCQGTWNKKTKSYPDRLVVFADLVH